MNHYFMAQSALHDAGMLTSIKTPNIKVFCHFSHYGFDYLIFILFLFFRYQFNEDCHGFLDLKVSGLLCLKTKNFSFEMGVPIGNFEFDMGLEIRASCVMYVGSTQRWEYEI